MLLLTLHRQNMDDQLLNMLSVKTLIIKQFMHIYCLAAVVLSSVCDNIIGENFARKEDNELLTHMMSHQFILEGIPTDPITLFTVKLISMS